MAVSSELEQPVPVEPISVKVKDFAVALSVANITFLRVWWELLTYSDSDTFLMKAPPAPSEFIAAILNVLLLAGILTIAASIVRRYVTGRIAQILLESALAIVFIFPAISLLVALSGRYPTLRELPFNLVGKKITIVLGFTAIVLAAYVLLRNRKINGAVILLPFVPLTFGQAIWKATTYNPQPFADKPLASFLPVAPDSPRIVWIIFDRLDQRLTFIDRSRGISLPEFDRLRQESVYATNAFPPSSYTIFSMPALTLGRMIGYADQRNKDTLLIRDRPNDPTVKWGSPNIFSEARAIGFNSGVVGWYLPYCRVLNQSLSACNWFEMARQHNSYDLTPNGSGTLPSIMGHEFRSLAETNFLSPFGQSLATRKHAHTYDALLNSALKTAADPKLNLVLLHFPIPHWPYFYNRRTGQYDLRNSLVYGYLDSLMLADLTLGKIRSDLEAAGLWDRTTLLVSADHSHRSAPLKLDGKTNPRVPFLLKMAGQKSGLEFTPDFNTVLTKDLLLAILKGEVTTPQHVREWLERHKSLAQSPYDQDL